MTGQELLTRTLAEFEKVLSGGQTSVVSPGSVKDVVGGINPRFGTLLQEDASELLVSITEIVDRESGGQSPLDSLIKGNVTQITECKVCLERTVDTQPFHQLQLPVSDKICTLQECWDRNFQDSVCV